MNLKNSLATQISWTTIGIVVITLLAMGIGLIWIAYHAEQESSYLVLEKNADKVAILISGYIGQVTKELELFEKMQVQSSKPGPEQKKALEELVLNRPETYSQVSLRDRNGTEQVKISRFHTYLPSELQILEKTDDFYDALNGSTSISPVYLSPESGLLSVQVTMPVQTWENDITGVLTAEVNVIRLWQEISRIQIGNQGYAYLVNENGRFIAYQDLVEVLQNYNRDMSTLPPVAEFLSQRTEGVRHVFEYQGLNDKPVIGVYAPIIGTDWGVITELPIEEAYEAVNRMQWYLIILLVLGTVAAGTIGLIVSRRLVHPIQSLTRTAEHMSTGDLNAEVFEVDRQDEVGMLARAFLQMQQELKSLYKNLEHQIDELKHTREELLDANREQSKTERELRTNYEILTMTEQKLRESQQRYHNVVEDQTELICRFTKDGTITFANTSFCRYYNITEEELIGRTFSSDIPREERQQLKAHFRSITPEHPIRVIEHRLILPEGEVRWQHWTDRGVFDTDGTIIEYQSVGRDITEKIQMEQSLNQALKKLNTLNSITFTEIQNAIYALTGYIELQNEPFPPEKRIEFFNIEKELLKRVLDSLKFARMYQDMGIKPPKWLSVSQLFLFAVSHLDMSQITRIIKVDNLEIFADPLFEQVLFILAENMIKHGERVTECSLTYQENSDGLIIIFEDNGIGISDDNKKRIFQKEYSMINRLGLFLAREILEITGLTLTETGVYGKGARFEIFVPKGGYRFVKKHDVHE